jgi:hypothetical protein
MYLAVMKAELLRRQKLEEQLKQEAREAGTE